MTFLDALKQQTDEKYLTLLDGKTQPLTTDITVASCEEYKTKNDNFHQRLRQEEASVQEALVTVQTAVQDRLNREHQARVAAELAEKKRLEKLEQERLAAERAEQERIRQIEEARLAAERAEKEKIEAAKRAEREKLEAEKRAEREKLEAVKRAEREKIEAEKRAVRMADEAARRKKQKIRNTVIGIVVLAAIIVGIIFMVKGRIAKYSVDNICITVTSKTVDTGYYQKGVNFTLIFQVENKSSMDVQQIVGNFKIYNAKGDCLLADTVTLNGTLNPGNIQEYTVNFSMSDTPKNIEIYETPLSGLKMTYQLTAVTYEEDNIKEYEDSTVKILCDTQPASDGKTSSGGNSQPVGTTPGDPDAQAYEDALALYNQGAYADAAPLFEALGDYKDSYDYYQASIYHNALQLYADKKYNEAITALNSIPEYPDSTEQIQTILSDLGAQAENLAHTGDYAGAAARLEVLDIELQQYTMYAAYNYAKEGHFDLAVQSGLQVVILPEGVETIPDNYFKTSPQNSCITTVVLPSTLKSIGASAFAGCATLTEITIPEGVTSIGDSAFTSCEGLTSVKFASTIQSIGNHAFRYCSGLTAVTLPVSLETLGQYAFAQCSGLQKVSMPTGPKEICNNAFEYCESLTEVTIGNGTEVIGSYVFYYCDMLETVLLPNSLKEIVNNAFYHCTALTEITIPGQVTEIDKNVFAECTALKNIYFVNPTGWFREGLFEQDFSDPAKNAQKLVTHSDNTFTRSDVN